MPSSTRRSTTAALIECSTMEARIVESGPSLAGTASTVTHASP